MKTDVYEANAVPADGAVFDLEQECEAWDWVRAAGVSPEDLRAALSESLSLDKAA
jgi:hypothetical protein